MQLLTENDIAKGTSPPNRQHLADYCRCQVAVRVVRFPLTISFSIRRLLLLATSPPFTSKIIHYVPFVLVELT